MYRDLTELWVLVASSMYPPNIARGGGPRQAPKGGTLSHLSYSNLLHKILDVAARSSLAVQLWSVFLVFRVSLRFCLTPKPDPTHGPPPVLEA